jgi:hypothetical protein
MKKTLIMLFILSLSSVYAQIPSGFNILDSLNEHVLILQNKKTQGIYNVNSSKFIKGAREVQFFFMERVNLLFEIDASNHIVTYHLSNDSLEEVASANKELVFYKHQKNYFFGDQIFTFSTYRNKLSSKTNLNKNSFPDKNLNSYHGYVGVKLNNDKIEVFRYLPEGEMAMIPLMDQYGYDSINEQDEAVYPPRDPAIYKSGVWDRKNGKWFIEPIYKLTHKFKGIYSCLFIDQDYLEYYDLYKLNKRNGIVEKAFNNVKSNSEIPFVDLFGSNYRTDGSQNSAVYTQGKKDFTLFHYRLFRDLEYANGEVYGTSAYYFAEELFEDKKGMLYTHSIYNYFFKIDSSYAFMPKYSKSLSLIPFKDKNYAFFAKDYQLNYDIDGDCFLRASFDFDSCMTTEDYCLVKSNSNETGHQLNAISGFEIVNEQYNYVHETKKEQLGDIMVTYSGQDSVILIDDAVGVYEVVRYASTPGVYSSGIFDVESDNWFIPPFNKWIQWNNDGFFICRPNQDDQGILKKEDPFLFDFMLFDESYLFKSVTLDRLNEELIKHDFKFNYE